MGILRLSQIIFWFIWILFLSVRKSKILEVKFLKLGNVSFHVKGGLFDYRMQTCGGIFWPEWLCLACLSPLCSKVVLRGTPKSPEDPCNWKIHEISKHEIPIKWIWAARNIYIQFYYFQKTQNFPAQKKRPEVAPLNARFRQIGAPV